MFINEVIERADRLVENEYSLEEKYHWCDVVSGEIRSLYQRNYKRVLLKRWKDNLFLLPQDCPYSYIEKIIFGLHEIDKDDMRTFGFRPTHIGDTMLLCFGKVPSIDNTPEMIEVIYFPVKRPIRRICLHNETITIPDRADSEKSYELIMNENCPFIPGDVVEVVYGDTKTVLNILTRSADFDEDELKLCYILEYGEGEADALPDGEITVDMRRIVTDRTVCDSPYDEMYIDYVCAQICFYQRKHDIYNQFISRYNNRIEEYGKIMKEFANKNDRTFFTDWWRL